MTSLDMTSSGISQTSCNQTQADPVEATLQRSNSPKAMHHELWQRIVQWQPDEPGCHFPFSQRLQQENGWTRAYTARAIDEYRKFLFLSQVAGHTVCPSDDIDQVWHQHLTYTRSYWEDLCGKILKRPLHHQPTKGGPSEKTHYVDLYSKTLTSYEEWFGVRPDERIWPEPLARFAPKEMQRVDLSKYLLVRYPNFGLASWSQLLTAIQIRLREIPLWPRRKKVAGFGLTMLLIPAAVPFGPLDWAGPDFLKWYVMIAIGAVATAFLLRHILWPDDPGIPENIGYFEVACLRGNWKLAVNSVLAKLLASKHVTSVVLGTKTQFLLSQAGASANSEFETSVLKALDQPTSLTLTELHQQLQGAGEQLETSLQQRGLLTANASYALAARAFPFLIMLVVSGIGMAKVTVGLSRGKPVAYLVIMLIAMGVLAVWFLIRPRVTSSARRWLRRQQQERSGLKEEAGADLRSPEQIALGTALFGAAALAGTQFLPLRTAWQANRGEPGSSGCGTAGCGASGCGGPSGCGGDGGGGCGGCGGD